MRDSYAHLVEESPRTRSACSLFARWEADLTDLLRVDPDHVLGRQYWYDFNKEQPAPPVTLADAARRRAAVGVPPGGAASRAIKRFVDWYIDKRQIENGEFGGGLSDDGDLTNWWPATAFMGVDPEKIRRSLDRHMDAYYDQGLFTNGLSTIQTDELHSYEEGIQVLGQAMLLDYGNPKQLERAMSTAARARAGHGGQQRRPPAHPDLATSAVRRWRTEGVWGWQKPSGFLAFHPAMSLVDYNGAPGVKKWLLELADGLVAHYGPDKVLRTTVQFETDEDRRTAEAQIAVSSERAWPLLWAAYRWTGERKYLAPMLDVGPRALSGISANALDHLGLRDSWRAALSSPEWMANRSDNARHVAWQMTGDVRHLESLYEDQVRTALLGSTSTPRAACRSTACRCR